MVGYVYPIVSRDAPPGKSENSEECFPMDQAAATKCIARSGRSLRQTDPTLRLVFVGDPTRGIPPCAACHGPQAQKLGAPSLHGQQAAYLERQLAAFNEGIRQNDINQQMRAIAVQLTPAEMHALAAYYGGANGIPAAEK